MRPDVVLFSSFACCLALLISERRRTYGTVGWLYAVAIIGGSILFVFIWAVTR